MVPPPPSAPDPGQKPAGAPQKTLTPAESRAAAIQEALREMAGGAAAAPPPPAPPPPAPPPAPPPPPKTGVDAILAVGRSLRDLAAAGAERIADLGSALGRGLQSIRKEWSGAELGQAVGTGLREAGPAPANADAAGRAVGKALQIYGGPGLASADTTGAAVGASMKEFGPRDPRSAGAAAGTALREAGESQSWWKRAEERAKALATALTQAGSTLLSGAAEAGQALGAAVGRWTEKGSAAVAEASRAVAQTLSELKQRAASAASGWLAEGKALCTAAGAALREAGGELARRGEPAAQAAGRVAALLASSAATAREALSPEALQALKLDRADLQRAWAATRGIIAGAAGGVAAAAQGTLAVAAGTLKTAYDGLQYLARGVYAAATHDTRPLDAYAPVSFAARASKEDKWIETGRRVGAALKQEVTALPEHVRTFWSDLTSGDPGRIERAGAQLGRGLFEVAVAVGPAKLGIAKRLDELQEAAKLGKLGKLAKQEKAVLERIQRLEKGLAKEQAAAGAGGSLDRKTLQRLAKAAEYEEKLENERAKLAVLMKRVETKKVADAIGVHLEQAEAGARIAKSFEVSIQIRPRSTFARDLIAKGKALPKIEKIKQKTIDEIDIALGAPPETYGLVAKYELPPKTLEGIKPSAIPREVLEKKLAARLKERERFGEDLERLIRDKKVVLSDKGIVLDARKGKPFTSDNDIFDIVGRDGKPLSKDLRRRVLRALKENGWNIEHEEATQWRTLKGRHPGRHEVYQEAKEELIDSHREQTMTGNRGKALIEIAPDGTFREVFVPPKTGAPPAGPSGLLWLPLPRMETLRRAA
jgi:hypothetical protein